jgi:steroid delta-isomerase-like uncharacterized protein
MSLTASLIRSYYAAFNQQNWDGMLALLTDDVAHDINQGGRQVGKDAFRSFLAHMDHCYAEQVVDLVVMVNEYGTRAAAEFVIEGTYVRTDAPHPSANGQRYTLPVGAFFEIRDGRIARISNFYNLPEWLRQVG